MLHVFEAEAPIEGGGEDGASDDAGGRLRQRAGRELVQAVQPVAEKGQQDHGREHGFAEYAQGAEEQQHRGEMARFKTPRAALVGSGTLV